MAVLDESLSLTGRVWSFKPFSDRTALALSQRHGVPEVVGKLLAIRGIDLNTAEGFLNPRLKDMLPDPFHLLDMDRAVGRMVTALLNGESIAVFGDYDVDGATSSALLKRYMVMLGRPLRVYIPDRMAEGYGPNRGAFDKLKAMGVNLVITVDCGIVAHDALGYARDLGLDVVVIDHHVGESALPPAVAVVNPNRLDETSPCGHLAAVGVTFLFLVALNQTLKQKGFFNTQPEPNLLLLLDIVALGTVCDVVPLHGVNRAFVAQGLKVLGRRMNTGLKVLSDVARLDEAPSPYHLGFILGPHINAGGRVGQSDMGTKLLSCDDAQEALLYAQALALHNSERKAIEADILEQAIRQAEGNTGSVIWVYGPNWHPGVIGIVASRLKDRYHKPAIVLAGDGKGVAKASCRSVRGVHLGQMILAARQEGVILAGGGHAMAGGFSVAENNLSQAQAFFESRISTVIARDNIRPLLDLDLSLPLTAANVGLLEQMERLSPFGVGNPQPRFAFSDVVVAFADVVGGAHVRCQLKDPARSWSSKAIAFRCADHPMGQALLNHRGKPLSVAGTLKKDTWGQTPSVQVIIEDIQRAP
ncbi:MAG: single-stranded-DNA-specific exonuclease RecJ [Alphaproteobacteria bacterium]